MEEKEAGAVQLGRALPDTRHWQAGRHRQRCNYAHAQGRTGRRGGQLRGSRIRPTYPVKKDPPPKKKEKTNKTTTTIVYFILN